MKFGKAGAHSRVALDFGKVGTAAILENLSGAASVGDYLWTVSDEGRTLERLERTGEGFGAAKQFSLDDLVEGIPGLEDEAELDLESIDVSNGRLWLCGSHCRVRRKPKQSGELNAKLRDRPSRSLLARFDLSRSGGSAKNPMTLPFTGRRSLRGWLSQDPYLSPFIELPSKENGLDIEGLAVVGDEVLLGLRGPVIDGIAVVVRLRLDDDFRIEGYELSFLDLGGLAIRDLTRADEGVWLIAGPVGDASGPFALHHWRPAEGSAIQLPARRFAWPAGSEKPEGICRHRHGGADGLLVVYDRPDADRVQGARYDADWFSLA